MIAERLTEVLETKSLAKGKHDPNGVMCVMEAAAYIAGEPWSDKPQCVCPSLTDFMVSWNDALPDDATRDCLLKPLLSVVIGTRSTKEVEMRRRWMAFDWLVREHAPAWMDLTPSLAPHAATLRALPEVTGESIQLCLPALQEARKSSNAADNAAENAARAAARDAAGDAAGDAAWAAARAAAWAAARDAARAAARDAARAAAWAAAGAAWAAARDALKPTTERLQSSAQDLVRRMAASQEIGRET